MRLEILQVPACPNVALLEQRLDEVLVDHYVPVERAHRVVEDLPTAAALGMTGSPTLLVDGVDPFAEPALAPSVSCRLYRDEDARLQGAPSVAALRRALRTPQSGQPGEEGATMTVGSGECCAVTADGPAAELSRDWRARAAPTDPVERATHRAILRAFAATGCPPGSGELDRTAADLETSAAQVLARLHAADVVRLGGDGEIRVAYPFSAVPTRHRVRLASGVEVFAMCVIDALGIPPMLGTDAVISTSDPSTGAPITVTAARGLFAWDPATAVVFVGARPGGGPSVETCCDYLNAFTDRGQADAWVQAHPHIPGETLAPAQAERLGKRIFGDLLTTRQAHGPEDL
nr:alkylmercury lyase family protein [Kibdelosporangium sp. MJ126-NF4]CEL17389.1 Organomercurial lyase [Kibdelosporangium sp. MJ126-NF4]CTQ91383.1 Organomercurial lyase (EC 4.99.1.2) [Kibdelosporangium sp. MJ126-NF4]